MPAAPGQVWGADPAIRNIITIASPIDLESGRGVIAGRPAPPRALNGAAQLVSSYTNLRLKALDPPPRAAALGDYAGIC